MPASYWVTVAVTAGAIIACVVLHYECLNLLSRRLPLPEGRNRPRILILIFSILALHIAEIWIFGGAYFLLLQLGIEGQGSIVGNVEMNLLDCVYYSAMVFTTVGFGDLLPTGALRFMTGTEAIAGLTFITWSASYSYLFMKKAWSVDGD